MNDLLTYLNIKQQQIEDYLDTCLPEESTYPSDIYRAMRHTLFAGGKRLRPIIALTVGEMLNGINEHLLPSACAIELIHTASLILDDLPCMDDAELRRGKPTSHKVFGEHIAILASFALFNRAYGLIAQIPDDININPNLYLQVIREISSVVGVEGMIGGQAIDLQSVGKSIDLDTLEYIHSHKTGALFIGVVRLGAILSNASAAELEAITIYAKNLGLAFQIVDDLLDVQSEENKLGKDVKQDTQKTTFVQFCGVEESKLLAQELIDYAQEALNPFGERASILKALAQYVVAREK